MNTEENTLQSDLYQKEFLSSSNKVTQKKAQMISARVGQSENGENTGALDDLDVNILKNCCRNLSCTTTWFLNLESVRKGKKK